MTKEARPSVSNERGEGDDRALLAAALHPGVNVESASLGLTICAERNAVFGAIARGARGFVRMAVVAEGRCPCVPCGACRQILIEHAPDLIFILERPDGGPEAVPLRSLLPRPFTEF